MSTVDIKIPFEIFERLEKHSKGFGDTPVNVIERLLNFIEGISPPKAMLKSPERNLAVGKDFTKYIFISIYRSSSAVSVIINWNLTYISWERHW